VVAIHGGPAAAGDLEPLARELGERWRVLEPHQRGSGGVPLTVASHVQDLDDVIRARCAGQRPVLLGHSWGAMLALACAAAHPQTPAAVVLVGCGTFSHAAREAFDARLAARLTTPDRDALAQAVALEDGDRRLAALGRVMTAVYGHDLDRPGPAPERLDLRAHQESWSDMLRCQEQGLYPAAFAAVRAPLLMLHGDADPHPGMATRDDLREHMPQLEYRELSRCGHSPWLERQARGPFFEAMESWLRQHVPSGAT
jgi:pimeloyl-ACP methyl ester carboxylesterase